MLIKPDLEKSSDHLLWGFVRDTSEEIGLSTTWVRNLMHCVESSRMYVLWNGKKLRWFQPSRGVH